MICTLLIVVSKRYSLKNFYCQVALRIKAPSCFNPQRSTISIFICLSLFQSYYSVAQTDTEFWFAAPEITYEILPPSPVICSNLDRPIKLVLSTFESDAVVTVDQPANPLFMPITQTILPGVATSLDLTAYLDMIENKPANTILNYGLRVRSNKPICGSYFVCHPLSTVLYTLMGRNGLGQEFIIPMQPHFNNHPNASPQARSCFDIVATRNNTTVTIVPSKPLIGHPALDHSPLY